MPAKFEIKKAKNGKFHFNLKAGNGEVILSSQMYTSKSSAKNGIASVRKNSPDADRYERLEGKKGQPYFVLKAANQQVIGTSEMYNDKRGRDNGIRSVRRNGGAKTVDDLTA